VAAGEHRRFILRQGGRHVPWVIDECLRQLSSILHRLIRSLPGERRHQVRRVADQGGAGMGVPTMPSRQGMNRACG